MREMVRQPVLDQCVAVAVCQRHRQWRTCRRVTFVPFGTDALPASLFAISRGLSTRH